MKLRFAALIIVMLLMFGCSKKSENTEATIDAEQAARDGRGIPVAWKIGEAAESTDITFTTSDGIEIAGTFRPASGNPEKSPGVICIPMLGRTRGDYDLFSRQLSETGIASLSLDLRGHGDSRMGGKVRFSSFDEKQWNECVRDVNAAIGWFYNNQNIDNRFVGLIGASIGANFAIKTGSRQEICLVVALSPGLDYHGVQIETDAGKIHEKPVYVIATDGDKYAAETASKLSQVMGSNADIQIIEGRNQHGTDMFRIPAFQEGLINWLVEHLGEMHREALTEEDLANRKESRRPAPIKGNPNL